VAWLLLAVGLYLALSIHQLGLPGLHYDEAREAGVNAMELLTGAPVSAFRGAAANIFGFALPLMVQDYIGALNVYLSLPFLALSGVGVPNLRILGILIGAAALLLLERSVSEWRCWWNAAESGALPVGATPARTPLTTSGLIAISLLALSPSFIFWSRQGIFVTNLTQPLCLLCIWQGVRWLRTDRPSALPVSTLAAGAALYAKLLAIWLIAPFFLLATIWWLDRRLRGRPHPRVNLWLALAAGAAFCIPLIPFALFNWQTGGTIGAMLNRLAVSYYGVDNFAVGANLIVRLGQLAQILVGDHLWYLGGVYGNALAPWAAVGLLIAGLILRPRLIAPPLLLTASAAVMSIFTVSDLFITHYALLQPFVVGVIALAAGVWLEERQPVEGFTRLPLQTRRWGAALVGALLAAWLLLDLSATVSYHRALTRSGGLSDHSDATYHLAYHLRMNGMGAPIALDWGMDANIRYLTEGSVTPVEIFGYESLQTPDAAFDERLRRFLDNPDNVYLVHAPGREVFRGRREAFLAAVKERSATTAREAIFSQRNGEPLFEIWKVGATE
jgi:hypothetical protein